MATIQSCRLVCTEQGHNKEYNVEVDEELNQHEHVYWYRVDGHYGRIGGTLTRVRKYHGSSRTHAFAVYDQLRREKLSKGYREAAVAPLVAPPAAPARQRRTSRRSNTTIPAPPASNTVEFFDDAPRRINL